MIILQIAGHLGQDPEVRFTPSGQKVTTFRVATNIRRGKKEKTIWWRVTVWGDRLDKVMSYLRKGSAVFVTGEMGIPEIYTDKSGAQQISFEITAEIISLNPFGKGGKPAGQGENAESGEGEGSHEMSHGVVPGAGQANFSEDDIPF
jgi:single-strand DNA-binding protein